MRDIGDQIASQQRVGVSPEPISRIADAVNGEIVERQNRPLEQVIASVYLDAIFLTIREDGAVSNREAIRLLRCARRRLRFNPSHCGPGTPSGEAEKTAQVPA